MKETILLPNRQLQGRGRVTLAYTDPVTGRVLEQVEGENHVFTAQLTGTTGFQNTAMKADLVLTQGGSAPSGEMPFLPGDPIGFGRYNTAGSGLYRGAYRTADSWVNRVTKSGVSSKFVYDFLPTQALGTVNWVGLTAALGTGSSTPAYVPPALGFSNVNRVYDCETQTYYRVAVASGSSGYHVHLHKKTCFAQEAETDWDVTALADLPELRTSSSYPRTVRVFLDNEAEVVYALVRGTPVGSTTAIYKVVGLSTAGALQGVWNITSGTSILTAANHPGAARDGKLYWLVPKTGYAAYGRCVCDLAAGTATETLVSATGPNFWRWDSNVAYCWKDCLWYARRDLLDPADDDLTGFLYVCPMLNLSDGASVYGTMPPAVRDATAVNFHVGPSPLASCAQQWVRSSYDDASLTMPFAYTRYAVPADTPARPSGSAMSVTYELNVNW